MQPARGAPAAGGQSRFRLRLNCDLRIAAMSNRLASAGQQTAKGVCTPGARPSWCELLAEGLLEIRAVRIKE